MGAGWGRPTPASPGRSGKGANSPGQPPRHLRCAPASVGPPGGPPGWGLAHPSIARSVYRPARMPSALDPGDIAVGEVRGGYAAGGDDPEKGAG
jgi:hypothetical protein